MPQKFKANKTFLVAMFTQKYKKSFIVKSVCSVYRDQTLCTVTTEQMIVYFSVGG